MDTVTFDNVYDQVEFVEENVESDERQEQVRAEPKSIQQRFQLPNSIHFWACLWSVSIVIVIVSCWLCWRAPTFQCNQAYVDLNSTQNSPVCLDHEIRRKQAFVKTMFVEAWNAYERYAWGNEALAPVTKKGISIRFGPNSGLTIVASMSTMWVMGLREEFNRGKQWIETELKFDNITSQIEVIDSVENYIGSLLSLYAQTHEREFLLKALDVGKVLEPAFNTKTGLPYLKINPKTKATDNASPTLTKIAHKQPELIFLANVSNGTVFQGRIERIFKFFRDINKTKGLYRRYVNVKTGAWDSDFSSLLQLGANFYSNMVKALVQSAGQDAEVAQMYKEAMDSVETNQLIVLSKTGLRFVRNLNTATNVYGDVMEHAGCYLGAILALGADAMKKAFHNNHFLNGARQRDENYRITHHQQLAEKLTETCHYASDRTRTGLPPAEFSTTDASPTSSKFNLGPQLAESYFILWRLTHDTKYRDYAWEMVQAIYRHCRVAESGGAYSTVADVDQIPTLKADLQSAHFMSGTLKYLYLIFSEDDVLPLDEWIFNSVGHPLPICGKSALYPWDLCKM